MGHGIEKKNKKETKHSLDARENIKQETLEYTESNLVRDYMLHYKLNIKTIKWLSDAIQRLKKLEPISGDPGKGKK